MYLTLIDRRSPRIRAAYTELGPRAWVRWDDLALGATSSGPNGMMHENYCIGRLLSEARNAGFPRQASFLKGVTLGALRHVRSGLTSEEDGRAVIRPLYPREQTLALRSSTLGYGA